MIERVVIVTKKTPLEELVERFNSRAQARFYIEHLGGSFEEYAAADARYAASVERLKRSIPRSLKTQLIERSFLPNFLFSDDCLVVTIGPDGLVVNTAKYLTRQPILAVNPDPERVDGILIPFAVEEAGEWVARAAEGRAAVQPVTMAKATLNTGQSLYGFNDLFIGPQSHISARYRIEFAGKAEDQMSSGIIVSTGAGSTGWLQSIVTGACRVAAGASKAKVAPPDQEQYRLPWDAEELYFTVREPFTSRISKANIVFGRIRRRQSLVLRSYMPERCVIFSDGIESDYLAFTAGTVATIGIADRKANLIVRNP